MRNTLIVIVVLLAAANISYWWPSKEIVREDLYDARPSYAKVAKLRDIRSLMLLPLHDDGVERDLFSPVKHEMIVLEPAPELNKRPFEKIVVKNIEKEQRATDGMSRYSLAGVLVRNGTKLAYMLDGLNAIIVKAGDILPDNAVVLSVTQTKLVIKDAVTGLEKTLYLNGE